MLFKESKKTISSHNSRLFNSFLYFGLFFNISWFFDHASSLWHYNFIWISYIDRLFNNNILSWINWINRLNDAMKLVFISLWKRTKPWLNNFHFLFDDFFINNPIIVNNRWCIVNVTHFEYCFVYKYFCKLIRFQISF
jgi:hypothetical protein